MSFAGFSSSTSSLRKNPGIQLPLPHPLRDASKQEVMQYALLSSITGTTGSFEDVKFYVYSRRNASGQVNTPRALFANRALLCKTSSHFDNLLSAGFAESELADLEAPYPPDKATQTTGYDYAEDSDLEDEIDEGRVSRPSSSASKKRRSRVVLSTISTTSSSRAFEGELRPPSSGDIPFTLKPEGPPSHNFEGPLLPIYATPLAPPSPAFEGNTSPAPPGAEEGTPYDEGAQGYEPQIRTIPTSDTTKKASPSRNGAYNDVSETAKSATNFAGRKGRVVFIEDFAYRTWAAFLFYAYFDKLSFAPLRSCERAAQHSAPKPYDAPLCSPKSMYRLAEKYDIPSLKNEAFYAIQSQLMAQNILVELFSPFTLTYPEIQGCEVEYLVEHISDEGMLKSVEKWLSLLEQGKLPSGSAAAVSSIVSKLAACKRSGWR
ncbi:hypothetical protein BN946_scf184976.g24 [Trametes cinnabarina]|uniref:BTB domain-containing protein n=1 Tax=Pycnoporus cinnabarinus TaxID=5643 RepID=A0A060S4R7_PYCCI|nr:hypothetical protein BN946_scf184976.g24 [Trametes cinnabarina]